jgi:tetratricopeptide (TPR) repeat protein
LQHEAVLLWPVVLTSTEYKYQLNDKRDACIAVINKAIKNYAAEKEYVSNLYNSKATLIPATDTLNIRRALEESIKIVPENIPAWDNLLKYYSSYDNAAGALMVEKLIVILKKKKDNAGIATAYVYKGDFLWRQNKKEEAKKAYTEALVWDPKNATATERNKMQ